MAFGKTLVLSLLVGGALALSSTAAFADDSAECVQSALNSLGYDIGTVDGQIGSGTKKAFEKYRKASKAPAFVLEPRFYSSWCLFMAKTAPVDATTKTYAATLATSVTITLNVSVTPEAVDRVEIHDAANEVLATSASFNEAVVEGKKVLFAQFPYAQVAAGTLICTIVKPNWAVTDKAGKLYEGSCDASAIEFWIGGARTMSYNVVKRE